MRLLISTGIFYPSQVGGPANSLYWLSKNLVKNGIDVTAIATDLGINKESILTNKWNDLDGIKIKYCRTNIINVFFIIIWNSIKEIPKNDAIMLSSFFYKPNIIIGIIALIYKKKIIWSPRGETLASKNFIKRLFLYVIKVIFAKKVSFHTTSYEEKLSLLFSMGRSTTCFTIPNLYELPPINKTASTDKYFLYMGRIAPIKALDRLLHGLSKSKEFLKSDYKLFIAGNVGKQFENYYKHLTFFIKNNNQMNEKVFFLGSIYGISKYKLYSNAYFTFLISHSENFGNVVIESLSQGTPVITSKGTPWKQLADNNAGFWIDNNVNTISQCVDEAINMNLNDYHIMRNNAYELAMKYDIKNNIDTWINILK